MADGAHGGAACRAASRAPVLQAGGGSDGAEGGWAGRRPPPRPPTGPGAAGGARRGPGLEGVRRGGRHRAPCRGLTKRRVFFPPLEEKQPCAEPSLKNVTWLNHDFSFLET